jgi:hypothetical protein
MTMLALALGFIFQAQQPGQQPQQPPLRAEGVGGRDITPAHETYDEDFVASDARARTAIQSYGACAAGRSRSAAAEVLTRNFTTREYQQGLRVLSRNNEDCFRRRGRMRSHNLLFAGAMAEHLIEQPSEPLNARLARAASLPPIEAFSPTDRVAGCVVRSVPDDVARLLATDVASQAELTAAQALGPIMSQCNAERRPLSVSPAGLRAMLATAAFRTLNMLAERSN